MPEPADRAKLERRFQRELRKLKESQRKELLRLLGDPPKLSNVPASFWTKIKDQDEQELAVLLALVAAMAAAEQLATFSSDPSVPTTFDLTGDDIEQLLDQSVRDRAEEMSGRMSETTRDRLARLDRAGKLTPDAAAEVVAGKARIEGIARTEVTAANSMGEVGAVEVAREADVPILQIWQMTPCDHCRLCPLLNRTPDIFWRRFLPMGPPAHPHCCCILIPYVGTVEQARRDGVIRRRNPSAAAIRRAARESGIVLQG